jgi:metal-responsive CopG/Arc/MetJ family transcriptional regulator
MLILLTFILKIRLHLYLSKWVSVTSISQSTSLLNKLDAIKDEKGYLSRLEVVRDAIRTYLSDHESQILIDGEITSKIAILYSVFF